MNMNKSKTMIYAKKWYKDQRYDKKKVYKNDKPNQDLKKIWNA